MVNLSLALWNSILALHLLLLPHVNASIFGLPHASARTLTAAAIFGFGRQNEPPNDNNNNPQQQPPPQAGSEEEQDPTQQQQQQPILPALDKFQPPPPPGRRPQMQMPPPPPRAGAKLHPQQQQADLAAPPPETTTSGQDTSERAIPPPPLVFPQQPPLADETAWQQPNDPSFGGGEWMPPPPDSMFHNPATAYTATEPFQLMQHDLEASLQREYALNNQLQNVTAVLAGMEQREELHIRQLDVLTERVMEVEAQAASEHNQLLESQANCTEMDLELATLRGDVDEWKQRCLQADERDQKQQSEHRKLVKKLERAHREAERLATRIEQHRLEDLRDTYQERRQRAAHKRGGGWLSWIFGGTANRREEEEAVTELQELAKATLLNALQTERNNVEELETTVTNLQQNNSVIAMQVKSRDEIIDELNERVAVFEEDKVVLKAALKQLQKEMAEEAPKTQKLVNDLQEAHEQIGQLEQDLNAMTEQQLEKVASLEGLISEKQDMIHQTEANVTLISEYVDKLEERLADFALARRDIDKRETQCLERETKAAEVEQECVKLQEQIQVRGAEHAELKTLMQEMVEDRTHLQQQLATLTAEKEHASQQRERVQASLEQLQQDHSTLQQEQQELKQQQRPPPPPPPPPSKVNANLQTQIQEYERQLAQLAEENARLQEGSVESSTVIATLREQVDMMLATQQELEALQQQAVSTKANLEQRLKEAVEAQQNAEQRLEQSMADHDSQFDAFKQQTREQLEELKAAAQLQLARKEQTLQEQLALERETAASQLGEEKERISQLLKEVQDKAAADLSAERERFTQLQQQQRQQQQQLDKDEDENEKDISTAKQAETKRVTWKESLVDVEAPPGPADADSSDSEAGLLEGDSINKETEEPELPPPASAATTAYDVGTNKEPSLPSVGGTTPPKEASVPSVSDESKPDHNEAKQAPLLQNATAPSVHPPVNRTSVQVVARRRPPPKPNSVGRSVRKLFAQGTGLHGFFSNKYRHPPPQKRPPPTLANGTATRPLPRDPAGVRPNNRGPPPNNSTGRPPQQQPMRGPERGKEPPGRVPHPIAPNGNRRQGGPA